MVCLTKNFRFLAAFLAVGFIFAATAGLSPAAAATSYKEWFQYGGSAGEAWKFSEVEGDPLQVSIQPKFSAGSEPKKQVFVIYSKRSSAYDVAITKILAVFEEKKINAEFRVFNIQKNDARAQEALKLAAATNSEMLFSMGSVATAWLWNNYQGGEIPVVSVCSKDPVMLGQTADYESGTGTNFAFTSLNMPIEVQMAYVLELKPDLTNLGVLVDSKNVSAVETQAKPIAEYAKSKGIRVLDIAVQDPENAREEVASLVGSAVATMRKNDPTLNNSVLWVTGSTSVFREITAINEHSDRVPVLSVVPEVVQEGADSAVLSIGISFESNAHIAAIYGADILEGKASVGDLKVGIVSPPDIAINFLKAREIALDIPFSFFESASVVYDYEGRMVRDKGKPVIATN